ncbi:MAG: hypothetical protein N2C13_01305 [Chloroflexota bacterium]
MSISDIHARLGNTAMLYFLLIALWGYYRFFRAQGVSSSYWGALALGEILLILQGLIGAYLWFAVAPPYRAIHILYGFVSLIMIPGAYLYTKGKDGRPEILIYGTATLIGVGLLLRGIFTGLPPGV